MPSLTAEQLENIANQYLDFYIKDEILDNSIQDKPLLAAMKAAQKPFPGGKEFISGNAKFKHSVSFQGYEGDDTVNYTNPANVKQYRYPWKELHGGIEMTHSELKKAGITVVDSAMGENTSTSSAEDEIRITDLFDDKMEDMNEGLLESYNKMMWLDGTQDAKAFPGILSMITDNPTVGIVGGIDRAQQPLWRNRALLGANKLTASRANQDICRTLRQEVRQLRRHGGAKNPLILCGSTALEALEIEVYEKGTLTLDNFTNNGATDIGLADISMKGVGTFEYDPTLDDLGYADRIYFIDTKYIYPRVMDGQDWKKHTPARPFDKYVLYRAITMTLGLIGRKFDSSGVYQLAKS